ncbi:MAG: hypothetical protein HKN68_15485 [Saprospiraceae bacterium]|nr:hypothetical protein [Saprospiraceae bacterium]
MTNSESETGAPIYSPYGLRILYALDDEGDTKLMVMPAEGEVIGKIQI